VMCLACATRKMVGVPPSPSLSYNYCSPNLNCISNTRTVSLLQSQPTRLLAKLLVHTIICN
jgi:hypothetical protein